MVSARHGLAATAKITRNFVSTLYMQVCGARAVDIRGRVSTSKGLRRQSPIASYRQCSTRCPTCVQMLGATHFGTTEEWSSLPIDTNQLPQKSLSNRFALRFLGHGLQMRPSVITLNIDKDLSYPFADSGFALTRTVLER